MQTQQALEKKPTTTAEASPLVVEAEKLFEQMKDFSQSVAKRAYEFFDARGRELGHELEDWFQAESEVLRWVPVEITESNSQIIVRAEVPGFNAADIKVSVEPKQLTISGKKEEKKEEQAETKFFSEFRSNQFCRVLTLPAAVEPSLANAALKEGVLELTLTKSAVHPPTNIEVQAV